MVTIITPIEMLVGMSLTRCDKPSAVVKPVMKEKPYFRKSMSILSNLPMLSSAPVSSSDDCLLESPSLKLTFLHICGKERRSIEYRLHLPSVSLSPPDSRRLIQHVLRN